MISLDFQSSQSNLENTWNTLTALVSNLDCLLKQSKQYRESSTLVAGLCIVSTIRCSISRLIFSLIQQIKPLTAPITVSRPSVSIPGTELITRSQWPVWQYVQGWSYSRRCVLDDKSPYLIPFHPPSLFRTSRTAVAPRDGRGRWWCKWAAQHHP